MVDVVRVRVVVYFAVFVVINYDVMKYLFATNLEHYKYMSTMYFPVLVQNISREVFAGRAFNGPTSKASVVIELSVVSTVMPSCLFASTLHLSARLAFLRVLDRKGDHHWGLRIVGKAGCN
jgi:hypothetical protein